MRTNGSVGIPTGFGREFDDWLNGGSQGGNLYGILAPLGVGKTWSSMVIGGAALDSGKDPFMLFLEGNLEKEGYRSLSVGTSISNSGLHTGTLELEDVKHALEVFKRKARATNSHYYLALHGNRSVYTPSLFRSKLVRYKPGIAIIDYLALMGLKTGDKLVDEWQVYSFISRELKKMAVSFDIPIWVTLQGNRGSNNKEQLSADDSSYYNLQRDFDGIIGISKVKGKQYVIRLNAVKGRDSKEEFKALYRTNWDNGKVVFESYVEDDEAF
jgi:replicative DNA helicase